ncbi:MAG TPA: choice-of-anchor B family protein [Gammaproteobacteria bacterium]
MKLPVSLCVMILFPLVIPLAQAAACENGESGGYACSHIEFIGHLSPAEMDGDGEVLNDIWGWVDPATGEEYALIGMQDGTAFVRINDDGTLEFLGRLAASDGDSGIQKTGASDHVHKRCHDELCGSEDSAWRDIKVFENYAYIVSEAPGHGLQIFDLTVLTTVTTPQQFAADEGESYYGYYSGIGHAHNLFINEETARAYIVGHDSATVAGGLHILDLSDPMNPEFMGEANSDGYTHDVQCVVYNGPDSDVPSNSEICFASNEDTLTIWDVTDAADPRVVSRNEYAGAQYAHQGWLSEDQEYFFLNDELDEQETGTRTHLRVFDVSDLDNPELAADYLAPTLAIDHNNYVHGRWLYQSNYAAGLRILDILDPLHPVEAAYFDPQPTDNADFYGTWSNYLFPSGKVAFSDIDDGLFVVKPVLSALTAPDLSVALTLSTASVDSGDTASGAFTVSNSTSLDATNLLVTLHLPADQTVLEIVESSGWTCEAGGRVVECRKDLMAAGSDDAFSFDILTAASGAVEVIVMVYGTEVDAAPADNLDAATLAVKAASAPPAPGSRGGGGGALAWLLLGVFAVGMRRALHS